MENELFESVGVLPTVGPKTVEQLKTLNIQTIYDLLTYFPFRYDDIEEMPLAMVLDGQKVVLKGIVATSPVFARFGYKKTRLSFKLKIDHDVIMINFFNQPWLSKQVEIGQELAIYGKYNEAKQSLAGMKIMAQKTSETDLAPVYSVNKSVKQKKLQSLIDLAIEGYLPSVEEIIPSQTRTHYRLMPESDMLRLMHHPNDAKEAQLARRTAIFREFFIFQMQLATLAQKEGSNAVGIAKHYDLKSVNSLIKLLPFELSPDQKTVVNEIFTDLKSAKQMKRLLQGDVGSGKTIVAVLAIFAAVTAGYQVALMVPTEILAQQHFQKIKVLLGEVGVFVQLLTGSTSAKSRKTIYEDLAAGKINVLIGTHALIQKQVVFAKLGLVIIDEQHRFGVNQRQALKDKGETPDVLAMTATPIPRTLALTVYGDMDISTIKSLPAGRLPIESFWKTTGQIAEVFTKMREQLAAGFQIYVVTPLIAESETLNVANAEKTYEKMAKMFAPTHSVVLLHGQMKSAEKEQIMADFVSGQTKILVTTSVIEVGVDVKNANMMVIFNADQFGLSQLHQLRGRIGRGSTQSYCYFVADPKTENGKKRMEIVSATNDGFVLAEEDLKLRGQGEIFGSRQSGLPEFQVGDVVANFQTLVEAKKVTAELIKTDPQLTNEELRPLRTLLEYKAQIDDWKYKEILWKLSQLMQWVAILRQNPWLKAS